LHPEWCTIGVFGIVAGVNPCFCFRRVRPIVVFRELSELRKVTGECSYRGFVFLIESIRSM